MRRLIIGFSLISILGLVSAGRARGDTFTWQLPSSLTIAPANYSTGIYFDVLDVPYFENGVAQSPGFLEFYTYAPPDNLGGFVLADSALDTLFIDAFGPQVYSGTENAPTFVPGTYVLNNDLPDGPLGTLVIAQDGTEDSFTYQSAIPTSEPSSLLLLLIGTGMLALLFFTRKKIDA